MIETMKSALPKTFLSGILPKAKAELAEPAKRCKSQKQSYAGMTWIDIEDPTKESIVKVAEDYKFQDIHVEQCLQKSQITQINLEEHYIFIIFYFPYFITAENRIANSQVSIFLGHNFLVTLHDSAQKQIVDQLFREYEANTITTPKTPGRMLYQLINYLLKDTAVLIESVFDELDQVEESVFKNTASDAQRIGQLRQKISRLRRTIDIQRSVLNELNEVIDTFTNERLARHYAINTKLSQKLTETIDEAKEMVEIFKDADFITSTEKTNDILAILTLLFTFTIPATVLGTFYGMNILLPGGIGSDSWTFLGPFTMFKLIIGISVGLALVMCVYFRKKKWF
jgi:magnesium transporter